MAKILIVGKPLREIGALNQFFSEKHKVDLAFTEANAASRLEKEIYDIIVFDLPENGADGITHLKKLQKYAPETPVIVTSKHERADLIVKSVKAGAADFLVKPFSQEKLDLTLDRELEKRLLKNEIDYLRRQQDVIYDFSRIVAVSPNMREVMSSVGKLADTDSPFLITGESGTGKSFLSGAIHFNSRRRKRPFVKVNCANIPETLLESELFGHEMGSFTGADKTRIGRFEQANGGTIFLDEIGELGHRLQAKILGVIDDLAFERLGGNKKILMHSRIISATNVDIRKEMEAGNFRMDLYYRINVLRVHLPPLRERRDCIEPLAYQLFEKLKRSVNKKIIGFSPEVIKRFKVYHWPGNIRQLSNIIERAILMEEGQVITPDNIILQEFDPSPPELPNQTPLRLGAEQEKAIILEALEQTMWSQKDAAARLNLSPRALNYRIRKYEITHKFWRRNR